MRRSLAYARKSRTVLRCEADLRQAPKKEQKDKPTPKEGTRKSSRQAEKRKADDHEGGKPKKSTKAKK
jgi:hypothetical protein